MRSLRSVDCRVAVVLFAGAACACATGANDASSARTTVPDVVTGARDEVRLLAPGEPPLRTVRFHPQVGAAASLRFEAGGTRAEIPSAVTARIATLVTAVSSDGSVT